MDFPLLLIFAAPVALAAIGETVSQRAGVINIGLEGSMLSGAFFAMLASQGTGSPWIGLLAGVSAGLALTLIQGWFTVFLAADQVVVGTAANLLALGITGTLYRSKFGQSGQLLSVPKIPSLHEIDPVLALLLLAIPVVWWLLHRTAWGLALRAAGEYPKAVEAAGFPVPVLQLQGLAFSGAFGGLGGAYLALGVTGSFAENMTAGRGFVAIAMVTFGRWNPFFVVAAALLVGYADSLQFAFQARDIGLPHELFVALPYIVALAVLILAGKGTLAPRSLGAAYRREK